MSLDWKATSVLVTGAGGFVGSHLCPRLLARGARVHGVSRDPARLAAEAPELHRLPLNWRQADLSDLAATRKLVHDTQPDCVFHLASIPAASRDLAMVPTTFASNLATTVNLLTALAERPPRRIVLAGSLEASVDPLHPSSPYAAAKAASSIYAHLFRTIYQLPIVTARLFMIYGPGQRDVAKLIPHTIRSILREESPSFGPGTRLVDWVYVEDVADGLIRCAESDAAIGQEIDLGTGTLTSIRDVVQTIAQLMQTTLPMNFGAIPERAREQVLAADPVATAAKIGAAPATTLRQGLEKTIAWYRANR